MQSFKHSDSFYYKALVEVMYRHGGQLYKSIDAVWCEECFGEFVNISMAIFTSTVVAWFDKIFTEVVLNYLWVLLRAW